jgi:ribosome-binding protein aMBF1 (putative translation factor)
MGDSGSGGTMPLSSSCEWCGSQIYSAAQIAPLGNQPGHNIYYCQSCDHYTWVERRAVEAQQQQQQQPQPKKT